MNKLKAAKRSLKDQWYLFAATIVVSGGLYTLMAPPSSAAPAAVNDCTLTNGVRPFVNLVVNNIRNAFDAFWGKIVIALALIGALVAAFRRGNNPWIRGAGIIILVAIVLAGFAAAFTGTDRCVNA